MTEKIIICDTCSKQIKDIVYEMTDKAGITMQLCWNCYCGIQLAGLFDEDDKIKENPVKEVREHAC